MGKRKRTFLITLGLILCVSIVIILLVSTLLNHFLGQHVTTEPIQIHEYVEHMGNYKQMDAYYTMGVSDGRLYVCSENQLFVFEDDQMKELDNAIDHTVGGEWNGFQMRQVIANDFLYFTAVKDISEDQPEGLYAYDLKSNSLLLLAEGKGSMYEGDFFYDESGTLFVAEDETRTRYYPIRGSLIDAATEKKEIYRYGTNTYELSFAYERRFQYDIAFTRCDEKGNCSNLIEENGIPANNRAYIIPCEHGILFINTPCEIPLYYVEGETGEVVALFPEIENFGMVSAVNVHDDYVYFSFLRYEKWGEIGKERYENDTLEGTYRISLIDYSVEKISDHIYNGLYIFDDTGIYACNHAGNLYKLDFDGNRITEIIKNSHILFPED